MVPAMKIPTAYMMALSLSVSYCPSIGAMETPTLSAPHDLPEMRSGITMSRTFPSVENTLVEA